MYQKSQVHEDVFIGLCYYASNDLTYIPHRIKSGPGSFKVEEIIDENLVTKDGDIYVYKITKKWGVNSTQLNNYLRRYGATTLGRKDKYAETIQYVLSKRRIGKEGFEYIGSISRDIRVSDLHLGNRFEITVEVKDTSRYKRKIEEIVLNDIQKSRIPNYFSYQRFGIHRINHIRGYRFVREMASISKDALRRELTNKYGGKDVARLLINSFQAYLFNQAINISIKRGGGLPKTKHRISLRNFEGRVLMSDAYPVIGYGLTYTPTELKEILEKIGFSIYDLKRLLYRFKYIGIDVYGDLRPVEILFLEPPEIWFDGDIVKIKFAISRGQYATQVIREIFKPRHPSRQGY